jgi:chemotaxis protein histidine kinase CheA
MGPWPDASQPHGDDGMPREELEKRLAELREGFRDELPQRLDDISTAWRVLQESGWNDGNAETLERLAHSLAGAGATFGLASISEAARALELAVEALRTGEAPSDDELVPIADLLVALSSAIQQA